MLQDIDAAIDSIDLDTVRCLIITGAGDKSFVAGADISAMVHMSKADACAYSKMGNDLFLKIEHLPIPVIAAINGFALGGGCELSMSCDIRICSDNAMFGQPEVQLGITPGYGGTQRMARLVGAGIAKELIYTCLLYTSTSPTRSPGWASSCSRRLRERMMFKRSSAPERRRQRRGKVK